MKKESQMTDITMEMLYALLAFMLFITAMVALAVSERRAKENIQAEKRMMSAMDKLFNMKEAT